jgi:hypothetical protein
MTINNRKIYIFGNSYSQYPGNFPHTVDHKHLWHQLLAKEFSSEIINLSLPGASITATAYEFEKIRDHLGHNDILIVLLAVVDTHFYFEDRPSLSTTRYLAWYDCPEEYSLEEKTAMEYYEQYLSHKAINRLMSINFLHQLNDLTQKLNLKTIVIRTYPEAHIDDDIVSERYPNLIISNGHLFPISQKEFESKELYDFVKTKTLNVDDFRPNHLTKENHKILAEKIGSSIKNQDALDLTEGFVTKNIGMHNYPDLLVVLTLKSKSNL